MWKFSFSIAFAAWDPILSSSRTASISSMSHWAGCSTINPSLSMKWLGKLIWSYLRWSVNRTLWFLIVTTRWRLIMNWSLRKERLCKRSWRQRMLKHWKTRLTSLKHFKLRGCTILGRIRAHLSALSIAFTSVAFWKKPVLNLKWSRSRAFRSI